MSETAFIARELTRSIKSDIQDINFIDHLFERVLDSEVMFQANHRKTERV